MTHFNPSRRAVLRLAASAAALPLAATVANAASHAAHETHTVTISNFAFSPANLSIKAGDSVVFINQDSAPHTATADNGSFDTGNLGRGAQATLTFNAPGTFSYFCAIHPMMKGSITIS